MAGTHIGLESQPKMVLTREQERFLKELKAQDFSEHKHGFQIRPDSHIPNLLEVTFKKKGESKNRTFKFIIKPNGELVVNFHDSHHRDFILFKRLFGSKVGFLKDIQEEPFQIILTRSEDQISRTSEHEDIFTPAQRTVVNKIRDCQYFENFDHDLNTMFQFAYHADVTDDPDINVETLLEVGRFRRDIEHFFRERDMIRILENATPTLKEECKSNARVAQLQLNEEESGELNLDSPRAAQPQPKEEESEELNLESPRGAASLPKKEVKEEDADKAKSNFNPVFVTPLCKYHVEITQSHPNLPLFLIVFKKTKSSNKCQFDFSVNKDGRIIFPTEDAGYNLFQKHSPEAHQFLLGLSEPQQHQSQVLAPGMVVQEEEKKEVPEEFDREAIAKQLKVARARHDDPQKSISKQVKESKYFDPNNNFGEIYEKIGIEITQFDPEHSPNIFLVFFEDFAGDELVFSFKVEENGELSFDEGELSFEEYDNFEFLEAIHPEAYQFLCNLKPRITRPSPTNSPEMSRKTSPLPDCEFKKDVLLNHFFHHHPLTPSKNPLRHSNSSDDDLRLLSPPTRVRQNSAPQTARTVTVDDRTLALPPLVKRFTGS